MKAAKSFIGFILVQLIVVGAFAVSYAKLTPKQEERLAEVVSTQPKYTPVNVERNEPLVITPLYDDPTVVSDEELAAVLYRVQPAFDPRELKPNFVEHALRTWRVTAQFQEPGVMSGEQMRDFLLNYANFMSSWGERAEPLLQARDTGIYVRWGHEAGASVHHDHTLACLTEAGIPLTQRVNALGRPNATLKDLLEQALYDFRLDERETEWSAMAFGLWLPPAANWTNGANRNLNFDLIAKRQIRGHKQFGVCAGTHRVYSLMALLRINAKYPILSDPVKDEAKDFLMNVRDSIMANQFEDGHWPYNWPDGKDAVTDPQDNPIYRDVIATGHHLEWQAIAPEDLQIPREMIRKAARWIIDNTTKQSREEIQKNYTFYSHVGNALALWRKTSPPDFWHKWEKEHPYVGKDEDKPAKNGKPDRSVPPKKDPNVIEVDPKSATEAESESEKEAEAATKPEESAE